MAHRSRRRAKRGQRGRHQSTEGKKATSVAVPPSGKSAVVVSRCARRLTAQTRAADGAEGHFAGTAALLSDVFQESLSELACFINAENIPSQCKHGFTRIVIIVLLSLHKQSCRKLDCFSL